MNRNLIASLYARAGGVYKRKLRMALATIQRALSLGAAGYIAVSGGKDSTVVLHLVRSLAPDMPAVYSNDEWNLPETDAYIARIPNLAQIAGKVQHSDWFTSWANGPINLPPGTIWVDAPHNNGLQTYAAAQGWNLVYLGLRQEESSKRRVHLRTNGPLFLAQSDHTWHCNPIHNWAWQDVWAYIVSNNLDYNRAYDRLEAIGVPPEHQRIGPLAVQRVLQYGQIAILKRGWPDLYARFSARYPQATTYT